MRNIKDIGFCCVCLGAWMCMGVASSPGQSLVVDGVAAMVNEEIITISDVMTSLPMDRIGAGGGGSASRERLLEAYNERLDEMIAMQLILQEAERQGVRLPGWMVDQRIAEIISERYGGDRARMLDDLAQRRMTFEEWREMLREQMVVSALRHARVEGNVAVSPRDVREYYDHNRAEFRREPGTRVRIITLLAGEDAPDGALEARTEALFEELHRGLSFEQAAREYSRDGMAAQGGDYGWIDPQDDLRPELAEALEPLEPGQYSDLIKTPEEWYLVYKQSERKSGLVLFEEVRDEIAEKLRREESERLYRRWISSLRDRAHIVTFDLP